MSKNITVFISYSRDNKEHADFVLSLINQLRKNGIDAKNDHMLLQRFGIIDFNHRLTQEIAYADFIIIICTPEYAKKADTNVGGIGFETSLLMPLKQTNLNKYKLVPVVKTTLPHSIPQYLSGINYIDFSDHSLFENNFKELLHRLTDHAYT